MNRTPRLCFARQIAPVLLMALSPVLLPSRSPGAVPMDPDSRHLSPAQELNIAQGEARESEQKRLLVGHQRYQEREAYQESIVAGLRWDLRARREVVSQPAYALKKSTPGAAEAQVSLWPASAVLLSVGCALLFRQCSSGSR